MCYDKWSHYLQLTNMSYMFFCDAEMLGHMLCLVGPVAILWDRLLLLETVMRKCHF